MSRAGIVTLAGRPNAGKSTLLNRLVGERLSITSPKPQSTRDRIVGILTRDAAGPGAAEPTQIVFFDTPGLLEPRDSLQRSMRAAALSALSDADVILYLVDAAADAAADAPVPLTDAAGLAAPPAAPTITVLNKVDTLARSRRSALRETAPNTLQISATTGEGVEQLLETVTRLLPESPFLYPADDVSVQPLRFFVAEFIREAALGQLGQEVPHSVAVQVEEFREHSDPLYIRAHLYVERASQKAILLGHKGSRIREIGRAARSRIEPLVGARIYLDLWVKVLPNWRRDAAALERLGYHLPPTADA